MKNFSIRNRSLAVALFFAASVGSLSSVPAMAADNSPDPGIRCAAKIAPGQYEFYLPGEKVVDVNGNRWVCGPDGIWFRDYSSVIRLPTTQVAVSSTSTLSATIAR
jgi:hypothetical protein